MPRPDWRRASGSLNARPLRGRGGRWSFSARRGGSERFTYRGGGGRAGSPFVIRRVAAGGEPGEGAFDALRLLRRMGCVVAGWVWVRVSGGGRLRRGVWTRFWAEVRGGFVVLSGEGGGVEGGVEEEGRVDYLFGVARGAVEVLEGGRGGGGVRIRIKRAARGQEDALEGGRRDTVSGAEDGKARGKTIGRLKRFALDKISRGDSHRLDVGGCTELLMRIPSAPEAEKWVWALQNATSAYESKSLGDFQLIDALGSGAFGRVYLVHDTVSGEHLALKVVDKNLVFRDRLHFESAVNERITLEMVQGHPFMARLRYAFQTTNCLYLVTDFYEGGDLFSFLRTYHAEVSDAQAVRIIAEVILSLECMHDMGIVYRDLKPENVLLDKHGHVRLADLGLAKVLRRDADYLTNTICGSLSYAAPEMLSERDYGLSFDLWTLGVFIYQVLTGDMPFETENRSRQDILKDQYRGEIPINGLTDSAYSLVCALLRPNPNRRPTCRDLHGYEFFTGINWDDLAAKRPHPDSLRDIMLKTSARALEETTAAAAASGGPTASPSDNKDAYLLRNFDPEEWSDMSFSDASDGMSTSSFFRPDFAERESTAPAVTRMLAGWSFNVDKVVPIEKPALAVRSLDLMDGLLTKKKSTVGKGSKWELFGNRTTRQQFNSRFAERSSM